MSSKMKIHWWEDAYGKSTCHVNSGSMMASGSYLGEVYFRGTLWYSVVKGSDEPTEHKNQSAAMKYVEELVGGERVNENN